MIDFESLEKGLSIGECTYNGLTRLRTLKKAIETETEISLKEIENKFSIVKETNDSKQVLQWIYQTIKQIGFFPLNDIKSYYKIRYGLI